MRESAGNISSGTATHRAYSFPKGANRNEWVAYGLEQTTSKVPEPKDAGQQ